MGRDARRVYLAYGSNLHPRRLQARVGTVELLGIVALPGWSLRFDKRGGDGSAKANLHPVPGRVDCAMAAAYSLRLDQLGRLDLYEGCGGGYETVDFTVDIQGDAVDAFTYLVPSQWITRALLPFDWYVELIVAGARFYGFDRSCGRYRGIRRNPMKSPNAPVANCLQWVCRRRNVTKRDLRQVIAVC